MNHQLRSRIRPEIIQHLAKKNWETRFTIPSGSSHIRVSKRVVTPHTCQTFWGLPKWCLPPSMLNGEYAWKQSILGVPPLCWFHSIYDQFGFYNHWKVPLSIPLQKQRQFQVLRISSPNSKVCFWLTALQLLLHESWIYASMIQQNPPQKNTFLRMTTDPSGVSNICPKQEHLALQMLLAIVESGSWLEAVRIRRSQSKSVHVGQPKFW